MLVHFAFKRLFLKRNVLTFERPLLALIRELCDVKFFTLEKIKQGFERLNRGVSNARKDIVNESPSNDIHMSLFGPAVYFGLVLEENASDIWAEIMEALDWFKDKSSWDLKKLASELANAKKNDLELLRRHFDTKILLNTPGIDIYAEDDVSFTFNGATFLAVEFQALDILYLMFDDPAININHNRVSFAFI